MTTHAIEARGLSKRYGDLVVLDGLDLEVQTGSVYGFLGPNGAGKSTTIKLMLDLIRPTAGSVTVLGHDAQHDGVLARSGVGYLPQQPHFHPYRTVRGVLSYMAHLSPRAPRGRVLHRRIDELLDQAGLAGKSRRRAGVLSGGERQRLGIAQALIGDPELLILDEPFSGLDPIGVEAMVEILVDRAAAGAAVVFSSHQLDLVEDLCEDVVIIAAGKVVLSGPVRELRSRSHHRYLDLELDSDRGDTLEAFQAFEVVGSSNGRLRLRVDDGTDLEPLVRTAKELGQIRQFSFTPPNLSEVFREVVGQ